VKAFFHPKAVVWKKVNADFCLAGTRSVSGTRSIPMERAVPGFRMSVLTGSHKGYYMAQRAVFGLEHWTDLPEEDQHIVMRDLVRSGVEFGPDRYRNIVAGKSQAERDGGHSFRTRQQGPVWRHSAYDWADQTLRIYAGRPMKRHPHQSFLREYCSPCSSPDWSGRHSGC